jgi:predicted metal-dependent peptidase
MDLKTHMSKARARLLLKSAFFGTLLVTTPSIITRDPRINTAATNGLKVWYNADFIAGLNVDELIGLIAHEVSHIALMHMFRRQHRDPMLWNMACDYAINGMLIAEGFRLPRGGLWDAKLTGMSAEQIYDMLVEEQPPQPQSQAGGQGEPGDEGDDGSGGGQPQSGDEGDDGSGGGQPQSGDGPPGAPKAAGQGVPGIGADLIEDDFGDDPDAAKAAKDEIRGRMVQAVNAGRMAGQLPAGIKRALEELIHPPVPWQDVLRPYMQSLVADDESWSRRNRRYSSVYLPRRSSPSLGKAVVIGDTSGSITDDDLKLIGGAVISIVEDTHPEVVYMLWADAQVAGRQVFQRGDTVELEPAGGGGTDMRVPLAEAAEHEPDVVILITDGRTPWPDTPPEFPVIVVCTSDKAIPFGEVIRV